jgi:hypothetical protein
MVIPASVRARRLAPGLEHEGVVDGDADDLVDALGAEIVGGADETRQVRGAAGAGEGARQAEDDHAAARDIVGQINRHRTFRAESDKLRVGELGSDLQGHGCAFVQLRFLPSRI